MDNDNKGGFSNIITGPKGATHASLGTLQHLGVPGQWSALDTVNDAGCEAFSAPAPCS